MGCSPSTLQVYPSPGRMMATFPLRPSFQYCEELMVYADDLTGTDSIPPPKQPSTQKSDIFDLEKFIEVDHRATLAPENLLHQPYNKLMDFLLSGLKDSLSKVRTIYRWVTAQPLDQLVIREEPDSSYPLHQFWRIQQGKGNYAQLILTLCRLAGVPCVIINGLMKGSTYTIGQKVTSDSLYGEWNAVLIDGNWRFLNAYWGACGEGDDEDLSDKQKKRGSKKTRSVYQCDENYFLTDPEHLSSSHFPFIPKWQLLEKPISLTEFEEMAFLKDRFFNLNMSLVTHSKCIVRSLNGEIDFRFQIPDSNSVNLKFRHIFSRLESNNVPSVGGNAVKQNQYVFIHKIQPDILSVEVRVPVAGVYRLELVGKDASIEKPGYDFDWIVLYKVVVDKGLGICPQFPETTSGDWGPGFEAHKLGLIALTHKTGRVKAPMGEAEIRFKTGPSAPKDLKFSHELSSATKTDISLTDRAVHWMEDNEVVFFVRTPMKGEYVLTLFAIDSPSSLKAEKEIFCNYLITSEQSGTHEPFPRDFGDGAGPRDGMVGMGVTPVSHTSPVIHCHREELKIVFELKKPIELFAALSGAGLRAADSKRLVQQSTRGKFVHFTIRMPAMGSYGLKVVGMDPTAAKTFQNIYDYLIEFKKLKHSKSGEKFPLDLPTETFERKESQLSIISELNENNAVEIGQPPVIEEVKVDNKPERIQLELEYPLEPDPRVGRVQHKIRQAVAEKNETNLEKAIQELHDLNLTYTGHEVTSAQMELNIIRTTREILEACRTQDPVQLQTAVDNLKERELQGLLRKEMLRAQRLIDRRNNIQKNLHDVLDLDYKAVAEIKSFANPPECVIKVMMATFLLLGNFEEEIQVWKNICLQLSRIGNDSFKTRINNLDPATLPVDIVLGAKGYIRDITLEKVLSVSAGAAAFYVWTQNVIKEIEDRYGDDISTVVPRTRKTQKVHVHVPTSSEQ